MTYRTIQLCLVFSAFLVGLGIAADPPKPSGVAADQAKPIVVVTPDAEKGGPLDEKESLTVALLSQQLATLDAQQETINALRTHLNEKRGVVFRVTCARYGIAAEKCVPEQTKAGLAVKAKAERPAPSAKKE